MNSFRFITTCIALVLSVISLRAQELVQGSFRFLTEVRVVSVKWDLSKVDIEGLTTDDFIEFKSYEEGQDYRDAFEKAGEDLGKYTKKMLKAELKRRKR